MYKKFIQKKNGFTMIELIIAVVLTLIISSSIYVFINITSNGYEDTRERNVLIDSAYNSINQIKTDIEMSLPNSIRITTSGSQTFLEMMEVSGGGQYRSQLTDTGKGDILDFTKADTSFDILSFPQQFNGGEYISVGSYGMPGLNPYNGDTISQYTGSTGLQSNIQIASKLFPLDVPQHKFYIVNNIISYVCDTSNHTLTKYWGYAPTANQPNSTVSGVLSTSANGLVAKYVNSCQFLYQEGTNTRNAIVDIFLTLKNNNNIVSLYGDSYVPND